MTLIYIANIRLPTEKAHGIQIIQMCAAFARAGAAVRLVVPTRKNFSFIGVDPFKYFGVEKNFSITRLYTPDPVLLFPFGGGVYTKVQGLLFSFSIRRFMKIPSSRDIDILYTRDEYLLPWLLRIGKRVVWEAHTLPSRAPAYVKYWERCEKIIAITNALRDDLIGFGVAANRIVVAPDGVDLKHFIDHLKYNTKADKIELRKQLGLRKDKYIVMYAGHLYARKGAQTLADAARLFSNDVSAVFVGGTANDLQQFRDKNIKNSHIHVIGHVSPAEVPQYLMAADVLVLPNSAQDTQSARHTSPMKLFEYMASGVPIIASDVPALREVLSSDMAQFFRPDDAQELAGRIAQIRLHREDAMQRAHTARECVLRYSWDARAYAIISLLFS